VPGGSFVIALNLRSQDGVASLAVAITTPVAGESVHQIRDSLGANYGDSPLNSVGCLAWSAPWNETVR
jgi:hypothetical protein